MPTTALSSTTSSSYVHADALRADFFMGEDAEPGLEFQAADEHHLADPGPSAMYDNPKRHQVRFQGAVAACGDASGGGSIALPAGHARRLILPARHRRAETSADAARHPD